MAWAGNVVADGLGRVRADKDGAGMADVRHPVCGLGDQQLKVLGGHAVGDVDGLGLIAAFDAPAHIGDTLLGSFAALIGQGGELFAEFGDNRIGNTFSDRNQGGNGNSIVFGLG